MKYEPLLGDRFYHIYNRGNNRENIFIEEKNYTYFLALLYKHLSPVAKVYAYCLLKNHFHLIVKTENIESKTISNAFSNFFNAYAKAINKAYNRTGSLFQDRFARKLLENENYLRNLVLYIHHNPEKHGLVQDFSTYSYSSYLNMISENIKLIEYNEIIDLFGDKENFISVHKAYREADLTGFKNL